MVKRTNKNAPSMSWQNQEPSNSEKGKFQLALIEYAERHSLKANKLAFSKQLLMKLIPTLAEMLPKWAPITSQNFRITRHVAHRSFYDVVRNLLRKPNGLQEQIDLRRQPEPKGDPNASQAGESQIDDEEESSIPVYGSESDE